MANGTIIESVSKEVMPIPDQAKMILVKDQVSMTKANEMFLIIKGLRKKIAETMDPIIKKNHEAHKEALAQKAKLEAPLILGEKWLNGQMTAYYQEQERIRKAEEERLRQEAIKAEMKRREEEETRKLAEAAVLEKMGAKDEADQLVNEAIQAKEEPVIIKVQEVSVPKVEMKGATVKTYWHAEVYDLMALVKAVANGQQPIYYLEAVMPNLNSIAKKEMNRLNIPGVRAVPDSKTQSTGR